MSGLDAFGTQLKRGDGASPEVFTAIASITKINGPKMKRETYDVTAHDTSVPWKEFIGGLKDGGEVSIEINYDPSVHNVLTADFEDLAPRNYQIVLPDSPPATWAFKAVLTEFSQEAPHDNKLTASLSFKASGKPIYS